jgi:glycerophosphoryl diester phosphodiesterase
MDIIAHRGYWKSCCEKNSLTAFKRALELGFGIETDFRDFDSRVVISHDLPDDNCISLEEFLFVVESIDTNITLAINVKSDGLQTIFKTNEKLKNISHFFFDMSVPDCLGYNKSNLPYYTRFSDIELTPSLYENSKGVWFDNFSSGELNLSMLEKFILDGKSVALVSPELHNFEHLEYWKALKEFLIIGSNLLNKSIALCTDFPVEAKEYFCE